MEYVVRLGSGSYLQRHSSITEMIARKMRLRSKRFLIRHRNKSGHEAGRDPRKENVSGIPLVKRLLKFWSKKFNPVLMNIM